MKRPFKLVFGLLIAYVIIRLLTEYLRPVRVRLEETSSSPPPPPAETDRQPERVDLNQADATALATLPGIDPALAERIVVHRQQAGAFASLDDLMQLRGIGPVLVEQLRPLVTLA